MKQIWKRLTAVTLAGVMCLSLAACGNKEEKADSAVPGTAANTEQTGTAALAQELGYGYLSAYETMDDMPLSYINRAMAVDGKLYLQGEYYDEETFEGGTRLYVRDLATGAVKELPLPELESTENSNEYIQQFSVCPDGSGYWLITSRYTWNPEDLEMPMEIYAEPEAAEDAEPAAETEADGFAAEAEAPAPEEADPDAVQDPAEFPDGLAEDGPEPGEDSAAENVLENSAVEEPEMDPDYAPPQEQYYAKKCDMDGKVVQEIDLSEVTKDLEYFYCQSVSQDGQGNLYLASDQTILCFSADGVYQNNLETPDMYVQSMVTTGDGTVLLSGWVFNEENGGSLGIYRLENGAFQRLEAELSHYGICDLYPGDGNSVLLNDGTYLYSLDASTGQTTKLLSWLDSDVNGNNIQSVAANGEDTILVVLSSFRRTGNWLLELGTLTKTPADQLPQRTILTLGAEYLDGQVQDAMIRFNRSSDAYRITLSDYGAYNTEEDPSAGSKQLDRDIISGSCPDILYLSSRSHLDRYVSKGTLADLNPLMEQDQDFDPGNLVDSPLKAFRRDGKLYALPYSFGLSTMYASAKLVGDRESWTLQDLGQIVAGLDPEVKIVQWGTQADFLSQMLYYNMDQYVDYGSASCSFDSEDFKSLLAVAAKLPADYSAYESGDGEVAMDDGDEMSALQRGDLLMTSSYGGTGSYAIKSMLKLYTRKNGIVRIGLPTSQGNGAILTVNSALAVSSRCADLQGAWSFLKTLTSEEFQENVWEYPILRTAFDKVLAEAMEPEYYIDENGERVDMDPVGWIGSTEYTMEPVTQADLEEFRAYVDGAAIMGSYDEDIMEIVTDEAGAYFAGDKTADEVAKLIQNRVTIYLGETS